MPAVEVRRSEPDEPCLRRQQQRHHTWNGVMEMTNLDLDLHDVAEEGEDGEEGEEVLRRQPDGLYIDDCPEGLFPPGLGGEGRVEGAGNASASRRPRRPRRPCDSPSKRQGSKRIGSKESAASSRAGDLAYFSDTDSEVGDYTANHPASPLSRLNGASWMQRSNVLLSAQPGVQAVPEEKPLFDSAQRHIRPNTHEPHQHGSGAAGLPTRSPHQYGGEAAGPPARRPHEYGGEAAGPPARRPHQYGGEAACPQARNPHQYGGEAPARARTTPTWGAPLAFAAPGAPLPAQQLGPGGYPAAHAAHAGALGGGSAAASAPAAAAWGWPPWYAAEGAAGPSEGGHSRTPARVVAESAVLPAPASAPPAAPPPVGPTTGTPARSSAAARGSQTGPEGTSDDFPKCQSASASRRSRRRGKESAKSHAPLDPGCITTLMIRNLPKELTQQDFMREVDSVFEGTYDFAYLPRNFTTGECQGYAFVNFLDPADASRFRASWHQTRRLGMGHLDRPLDVSSAHIQGYQANVAKAYAPHACNIRNPNYRRVFTDRQDEEEAACAPRDVPVDAWQYSNFRPAAPALAARAGPPGSDQHCAGRVILSTPGGQPGRPHVQPQMPMDMHPAHIQVPCDSYAVGQPARAPREQRPPPRETFDTFQMAQQVSAFSSLMEAPPGMYLSR